MVLNMEKLKRVNKYRLTSNSDGMFTILDNGDDVLFNFGKHQGKKVSELFEDEESQQYLIWLYGLQDTPKEVVDIMDEYIEKLL